MCVCVYVWCAGHKVMLSIEKKTKQKKKGEEAHEGTRTKTYVYNIYVYAIWFLTR